MYTNLSMPCPFCFLFFLLIGFIISLFTFELVFISSSLTSTMPIPLSIKYNNLSMTCETFGKRQQNKHYIPLIGVVSVVCWHKTDINARDTCWVGNYCLWFLRMTFNLNLCGNPAFAHSMVWPSHVALFPPSSWPLLLKSQ